MKNYVFIGNRSSVLRAMREQNLSVKNIITPQDSYLAKELKEQNVDFDTVQNQAQLLQIIRNVDFDILVSNGCPYILPVSQLKKAEQKFINIHPSYLPDLKGINPINGAILFSRPAGATCHIMDDGIDSGPIISRIEIPITPDIDLGLLYKLAFLAEFDVFLQALKRDFIPDNISHSSDQPPIYYTRKPEDLIIDFSKSNEEIVQRIRAFGIPAQGAYFVFQGNKLKVMDAEIITNSYFITKIEIYREGEIVFIYDNNLIMRKNDAFLKLQNIIGNISSLAEGDIIS